MVSDYLLLPALGLCAASVFTLAGATLIERLHCNLSFPLWFLGVSLASPVAWFLFQALTLAIILPSVHVRAGNWPLYVQDVLIGIGLKLWICGAVCTAALGIFKRRGSKSRESDWRAKHALWLTTGALASAILLPMTMTYWVENGRMSGSFVLFTLGCAFVVGGVPVIAIAIGLTRIWGVGAQLRYAELIAAVYALVIICCGYIWHHAVLTEPGANAVIAVEICALFGVFLGWFGVRRSNRAAGQLLAGSAHSKTVV